MHQLIVYQVGKRGKIIMSNNLSLTTLNPDKAQSLVHIVPIWGKEQNISNNILLTILYPDKVQSNASESCVL